MSAAKYENTGLGKDATRVRILAHVQSSGVKSVTEGQQVNVMLPFMSRRGQGSARQGRGGQGRAGQGRAGQSRAGQDASRQGTASWAVVEAIHRGLCMLTRR